MSTLVSIIFWHEPDQVNLEVYMKQDPSSRGISSKQGRDIQSLGRRVACNTVMGNRLSYFKDSKAMPIGPWLWWW